MTIPANRRFGRIVVSPCLGLGLALATALAAPAADGAGFAPSVVASGGPPAGRDVDTASAADPTAPPPLYDPAVLAELSQGPAYWSVQPSGTGHTLRAVDFVDEDHGWAVGGQGDDDCVILRTEDGGETWEHAHCPVQLRPEDVHFVDRSTGWLIGRAGLIMRSDDGGRTWGRQGSPTSDALTSVFMLDRDHGWITNRDGRVFRTLDGGGRWRNENGKEGVGLFDVKFVDRNVGWAVGSQGTIILSSDGGDSWSGLSSGTDGRLYSIEMVNARRGWVVGNEIRSTRDGGGSWHREFTPSKSVDEVSFGDETHGWAAGDEGYIVYTPDDGQTWVREAEGLTGRSFRALTTYGRRHVWVVGTDGLIVHRYEPDAPLPPGTEPTDEPPPPPTDTPRPTATPTITPSPTPTMTPTPTGPWVRIAWAGPGPDILVGAHGTHDRLVTAIFGNMPASAAISGTIEGAATFAGGETAFASTVFPVNGSGEFPIVIEALPDAVPGAPFAVRMLIEGATAERPGRVAWQTTFPWLRP